MNLSYQKIHHIIDSFYKKARTDILIGFHFNHIKDFDAHIEHIALFWEFQLKGKISKQLSHPFNVPDAHLKLRINIGQLNRWIVLFNQTLKEEITDQDIIKEWEEKVEFFKKIFEKNFLVS